MFEFAMSEEDTERKKQMVNLLTEIFPKYLRENVFSRTVKKVMDFLVNNFNGRREDFGRSIDLRMPENGNGFSDIVANGNGKHQET